MKNIPRKHVPLLATVGVLIVLFGGASLSFDGFCSPFVVADLPASLETITIGTLLLIFIILQKTLSRLR